jgi:hypothetical protein
MFICNDCRGKEGRKSRTKKIESERERINLF